MKENFVTFAEQLLINSKYHTSREQSYSQSTESSVLFSLLSRRILRNSSSVGNGVEAKWSRTFFVFPRLLPEP